MCYLKYGSKKVLCRASLYSFALPKASELEKNVFKKYR